MSKDETFDEFRLRREIERMEQEFRKRASVQRERVEQLLAGDERTEEIERKVQQEMRDFLMDSTNAAEQVLEQYSHAQGPDGQTQEEIRGKLREFITGMSGSPPEGMGSAQERQTQVPPASRAGPFGESQVERRPLGVVSKSPRPRDLRSALQKLRGGNDQETGHPSDTPGEQDALRGGTRSHILDRFDSTLDGFSSILAKAEGESPGPSEARGPSAALPDAHQVSRGRGPGAHREGINVVEDRLPPLADPDGEFGPGRFADMDSTFGGHSGPRLQPTEFAEVSERFEPRAIPDADPPPSRAPSAQAPSQRAEPAHVQPSHAQSSRAPSPGFPSPGAPSPVGGAVNAFQADPEEDQDIDEKLEIADPEGWDLPTSPEAPGAWVVARQKAEGEAGLSGIAGDSYLMKKLCQEVRNLNRLYLALLEKGVVKREDVEGPGGGATRPAGADDDEDDDDAVSVEDFTEERYRPILTTDQDFSLSGLVADVHRLKTLREVLVKKKVVTEKELKKAEG